MRNSEHKPLSFSTTMRNPERISQFVACIKEFEGQILTNEIIMKIVKKIIGKKLYKPMCILNDNNLKNIYDNENLSFSDKQIVEIINRSPQKHKEAKFAKGWPSRFDTWFKLCKEFGFIYYEMDKKIEISTSGHILCDAYSENTDNSGEKIQKIFLNTLSKYQTNNPFRRNVNENAPIPLLLNVLKLLKSNTQSSGIFRKELPFLICWRNSNHIELYNFIINFRKKYGFKASDELVYEECLNLLASDNRKRFKISQIINEGVDDLIRKLRITGLFSLRGMGRFIDINKLESETAEYVISQYTNYKKFTDEYDFYNYMGEIDTNIFTFKEVETDIISDIRLKALKIFAQKYSVDEIYEELENLQMNRASRDEYLKLIDAPTRLEFLTSITLLQNFTHYDIYPNYSIDDEGNPTFTAKGGVADIEVYDSKLDSLVEVTMMKSAQQACNEIPAITRHLREQRKRSNKENVFSVFIAPYLHADTIYMCQFTMYQESLGIYPFTIIDFAKKIQTINSLLEMKYIV